MAVSIVISAINALTLSPALCAILLKPHNADGHGQKTSFVDRFHVGFNTAFEKILTKYRKGVENLIGHRIITGVIVLVGIIVLVFSMSTTKTGLVPNEDTGTLFVRWMRCWLTTQ